MTPSETKVDESFRFAVQITETAMRKSAASVEQEKPDLASGIIYYADQLKQPLDREYGDTFRFTIRVLERAMRMSADSEEKDDPEIAHSLNYYADRLKDALDGKPKRFSPRPDA